MSYTNGLDNPELYFQTKLFTGNGSTQSITLDGSENMQPDWVWFKNRSSVQNHRLFDSVRGAGKNLVSNNNGAEIDAGTGTGGQLRTFDSNGFSIGDDNSVNKNTENIVAWNWKESATAGFDIVTYTGNETARTISHSLSAVPHMMIIKNRGTTGNWAVYHIGLGTANKRLELDSNAVTDTGTSVWNDTDPTSSVFSVGNNDRITNGNTMTYVGYLFAPKQGFSKFGSYTGNGSTDGIFVYTGFRPAWIMRKNTDGGVTESWIMQDNKRNTFNVVDKWLEANATVAEDTAYQTDFLSNGFKMRSNNDGTNRSGTNYIYMAFAEQPFVTSTGVPATAR